MMPGMVATGLARVSDSMRGLQLSSGLSSSSSASSASSSASSAASSAASSSASSSASVSAATSTAAAVSASSSTAAAEAAAAASARLPSAAAEAQPPPSSSSRVAVSSYSISLASSTTSSSAHAHNEQGGCTLSRSGDGERPNSGKIAADDDGGDGGGGDDGSRADEKETAAANEHSAATRHSDSHTGGPCRPKGPSPAPSSAPHNALPRSASWVQLSGHEGSLMPSHSGTVLKRFCPHEQRCLQLLMGDAPLRPFVPEFHGDTTITTTTATVVVAAATTVAVTTTPARPSRYRSSSQRYNRMQDLLAGFRAPAAMDCKMGVRTYLEEELALARRDPQPRADMLAKMVAVDPTAPTALERECGAVTKPRYMQWRELCSSSASLGFRIEATKKSDGTLRQDFKRTKSRDEVLAALEEFVGGDAVVMESYIRRLRALRAALEVSPFFRSHEVIGSSLLFVHDAGGPAGVWMIDFSKTRPLPPGAALDHRTAWREGNREDGYLGGLDNLVAILEEVAATAATGAAPRGRRRC